MTELDLWRRALARSTGRDFWCGVRDFAGEPSAAELPDGADLPPSRRELFKLLGASAALAGLTGCPERPAGEIVPYVQQPPEVTPGVPQYYATSMVLDGFATGLLAESHTGRPTKLEGNPEHPASLGATGVYAQASVLELYDPSRARGLLRDGLPASWRAFADQLAAAGPEPWFVMYPQSSPLIAALIEEVRALRPGARFCFHSPLHRGAVYAAAQSVWGRPLDAHYDFRRATRVLALDADFTAAMPMSVRWAREFAARRRLDEPADDPGRLYVVEPMPTPTGTLADHRLAVRASDVAGVAAAVLAELLALAPESPAGSRALAPALRRLAGDRHRRWARVVARDLAAHAGASIAIAGDGQPPATHALAHAINEVLGNHGRTVTLAPPALLEPDGGAPLEELAAALAAGTADTVCILEANPVYTAPAELELATLLARAPNTAHLSLFHNETSQACRWFVPAAHYLEAWGDARAYDGTLSFVQPLIRPLFGGKSAAELLAAFAGAPAGTLEREGHELLRDHWQRDPAIAGAWRQHLQRGFAPDTAFAPVTPELRWTGVAAELERTAAAAPPDRLELCFEPSPAVYDGRFASNGWLQELPHPLTKLTWDNAAIMSPRTAVELGVDTERVVELRVAGRSLRAPALVLPGHADGAVSIALGYGRRGDERLAVGVGANAYAVRATAVARFTGGLQVSPADARHSLAFTQDHWRMHGRPIALRASLDHYRARPDFTAEHRGPQPSWLPAYDYSEPEQWAMTIDTTVCTGCSSCVVACQAENNIPIVGKEGVRHSREMHWLRIDRYFAGHVEDPEIVNQPMMCQHCEKAPCEYVCPTFATVHSPDGLNEMVYNRCIGTRFCSNNCPYKVRRFNYFEYNGAEPVSPIGLQRNPSVSVRSRGVMEKCTYCVQRIRGAGIQARLEGRSPRPGEVRTACQQACPTEAIQFGSLMHETTAMVQWRRQPRAYEVLHELGTRPRTMYLAKITNPNPELA